MKATVSVFLMGLALVFVGCGGNHDAHKDAKDKTVKVDVDKAVDKVTDKAKEATDRTEAELEKVTDKAKADADKLKKDAERANKLIDKVKHDI
jgi:prefoldin subunit 5